MVKKKKESQVVFLLDQTGSMQECKKDTIGGFNNFLEEQKKNKTDKLKFSLTLFNSAKVEKRYADEEIKNVKPLSDASYIPSNLTPLWDAMGNTIQSMPEAKDVLFVIMTDGYENYSKEFKAEAVKKMIKEKEKDCGWKFLFLGADLANFNDAFNVGINFNFNVSKKDMNTAYVNLSNTVGHYRSTGEVRYDGTDYYKK
ncbi:hypothetical protein ES703_60018 [subsurface metagenome]